MHQLTRHPGIDFPKIVDEGLEVGIGNFAAWQRRACGPVVPHLRKDVLKSVQTALGKFAEGRDLSAEHIEQRSAAGLVQVEDIVAGHGRRIAFAVIEQRPHAGEAEQHVVASQLLLEIAVHRGEQVVNLAVLRLHVLGAAPS